MSLLFISVSFWHTDYVCDVCDERTMQNKRDEKVPQNWSQVSYLFNAILLKLFKMSSVKTHVFLEECVLHLVWARVCYSFIISLS